MNSQWVNGSEMKGLHKSKHASFSRSGKPAGSSAGTYSGSACGQIMENTSFKGAKLGRQTFINVNIVNWTETFKGLHDWRPINAFRVQITFNVHYESASQCFIITVLQTLK